MTRLGAFAILILCLTGPLLAQGTDSTHLPDTAPSAIAPVASPPDSLPPRKDGWGDFSLSATLSGYHSSDSGHAASATVDFDISRSFRWKLLAITPSLDLEAQDALPHTTVVNSATASLAASVSPLSWLSFTARGFRLFQDSVDDYGAYLHAGLAASLPAGIAASASAGISDNHLGRPIPSASIGLSQDLDVFDWSLSGSWSRESQSYTNIRIRTAVKQAKTGALISDTTVSDTSAYANLWSASASMNVSGDDWSTGPSAGFTWSTVPMGTSRIVTQGANGKSNETSSATARNTNVELGWNAVWSPLDWLNLTASIANTWAWQQLKVASKGKGKTASSPQQLKQRAKELGTPSPPPAGLSLTLEADVSF